MNIIENNKIPSFNEKLYSYMISTQSGVKNVSKTLSFDLFRNSITSKESDCFPSCCSMAALYWKQHIPNLNLETNIDYWNKFREKFSFQNIKGVSLKGIYSNLSLNMPKNNNEKDIKNIPPIDIIDTNNTNELIEAQLLRFCRYLKKDSNEKDEETPIQEKRIIRRIMVKIEVNEDKLQIYKILEEFEKDESLKKTKNKEIK